MFATWEFWLLAASVLFLASRLHAQWHSLPLLIDRDPIYTDLKAPFVPLLPGLALLHFGILRQITQNVLRQRAYFRTAIVDNKE